MSSVLPFIKRFVPGLAPVSLGERLRASIGALIGILVTGAVAGLALGGTSDVPLLIAPMGASAVLLFAVPTSPLAQPWSIIGGNTIAALIGGGGFGVFVFQGIGQTAMDLVLLGAVPTVALAFAAAVVLDAMVEMTSRGGRSA